MEKIQDLKKGELFMLKPANKVIESNIYVRGDYNRSTKRYECYKWSDINHFKDLKKNTKVFIDFEF